jgi:diacylglycerol kinase (ATP)
MAARELLKPFTTAIGGVVYAFKTQRHMRVHLYTVVVIILIGFFMDLRLREMIVLLFMISFVVVAEMFNSAIEAVVDIAHPQYHPLAKFAKDMAAGGVLITTMTAIVVALLLFIGDGRWQEIALQLKSPELQTGVPLRIIVGSVILMALIIIGKGLGKRGQVLKGGLVSGHATFAFFFAAILVFLTGKLLPGLIGLFLAFMVAQSRWESKIHTTFELSLGAVLGVGMAVVLFGLGPS